MSSWKAAESRIGTWFGAKGINKSGRVPLSGGGSGSTRSDSPHRTIFIETKRDKTYHSVIKLWRSHKKKKNSLHVQALPKVEDNKIISKVSDLWCLYSNDLQNIASALANGNEIIVHEWFGNYPKALTLYNEAISIKNSTILDRNKEVVCCSLVYHSSPGFWIVIHKDDIIKCWELIVIEREYRERLLAEEDDFKRGL